MVHRGGRGAIRKIVRELEILEGLSDRLWCVEIHRTHKHGMLGISGGVQKVGDHPDARTGCSRIVAIRHSWQSWVLKAQDRSGSFRCRAPVEVEGIASVKVYDLASDRADGLQDAIGIVSVVQHEQVAGIDGNASRTQSHAAYR